MPWLADTDVGAVYGLARSLVGARTEAELRARTGVAEWLALPPRPDAHLEAKLDVRTAGGAVARALRERL